MRASARARLAPLAAVAAALLVAVAGCEGGGEAEPAEAATVDAGDGGAEAGDESEQETGPTAPLTGLPLDEAQADDVLNRPIVAVRIDNAPAARPQTGLEDAEVTFVTPVEGGLTRFVALYQAAAPELVGPVRSARAYDAELLRGLDPLFAHSGAAPAAHAVLAGSGLALREEGQPSQAWQRDASLPAPHNLFASPSALPAEDAGAPAVERAWPIAAGEPSLGSADEAGGVALRYSSAAEAAWAWDGEAWARSQDGEPHVTAGGEAITAANVVIARVEARHGDRRDAAGNPVVDLALRGGGSALVLADGRAAEARWEREEGGLFRWTTPDGHPIELAPGRTWVELVPAGAGAVETLPAAVG